MIEIGQTKHSATVIRLNFVFAHDDGLHAAGLELRHRPSGRCKHGARFGLEGF
jgi:hypothetical protein